MTEPTVSVVIPVYDRADMLAAASESVLAQTYSDWELIIVDDCSDDGTRETADRLAAWDSRISVLHLDAHSGMVGLVRNRGVERSSGRYIAFLDSDDLWKPEKLELQMKMFRESDYRIIHTGEIWLRNGKIVSQAFRHHRREGNVFADALQKCMMGPSTVIMERSLFLETGGFDETLEVAEDYELWLRITASEPVGYLNRELTIKKAGDWDQLSRKYGQIEIFHIRALEKLLEGNFFSGTELELASRVFCRKCGIYSAGCRKRGRMQEAEYYEKKIEIFR